MVVDLAALPEGTNEKDSEESAEELRLSDEVWQFPNAVRVHLATEKDNDEIVAEGRLATDGQATCVRCLEDFSVAVEEPFRVILRLVTDEEAKEDSGDDDFFLVPKSAPSWDTAPLFREVILLAIPRNPLCNPECSGLCAGCGRNLNVDTCVCEEKPADGPLARLRGLLNGAEQQD